MLGSVYRRHDGLWCAALQARGKRKVVYARTEQSARRKLADLQRQFGATGRLPDPGRRTVNDLFVEWLNSATLKPRTRADYENPQPSLHPAHNWTGQALTPGRDTPPTALRGPPDARTQASLSPCSRAHVIWSFESRQQTPNVVREACPENSGIARFSVPVAGARTRRSDHQGLGTGEPILTTEGPDSEVRTLGILLPGLVVIASRDRLLDLPDPGRLLDLVPNDFSGHHASRGRKHLGILHHPVRRDPIGFLGVRFGFEDAG